MSIAPDLLELAAQVALDYVMKEKRSDELIRIFKDWAKGKKKEQIDSTVDNAASAAIDPEKLNEAINKAELKFTNNATSEQLETAKRAVMFGVTRLKAGSASAVIKAIQEGTDPWKAKVFVLFLDDERIVNEPRFVHFNWEGDTYRVRDFLGGRILGPDGVNVTAKGAMTVGKLDLTARQIWDASLVRIPSAKRYGLGFKVEERDQWIARMELLTEAAQQILTAKVR